MLEKTNEFIKTASVTDLITWLNKYGIDVEEKD